MLSGKGASKIRSKPTEEYPRRSMISIKPLRNSMLLHTYRTPPTRTPLDGCFWTEREESKSIYKKLYIKGYENLLERNIIYIFIVIINPQNLLYVCCMKYLVNMPIFHMFYVQSTIIKPCRMYFRNTFTTFVGQLMILMAHAFIQK